MIFSPLTSEQFFAGQLKYYRMLQAVETLKDLNKTKPYETLLESRRIKSNLIERVMIGFMWGVIRELKQNKLAEITKRIIHETK